MMPYDLFQHRHNFAVWAAARAVQRGWGGASTRVLQAALEQCGAREFAMNPNSIVPTKDAFNKKHAQWCASILEQLGNRGLSQDCSFGRAAKLVAVYLKSMIVVGGFDDLPVAALIHPPIDRKLLQNMAHEFSHNRAASGWAKCNWTKLDKKKYYRLVDQLTSAAAKSPPLWMIEEYWLLGDST
jgi:hypothetical protein